jgi:hypothetical protein
MNKYIRQIFLLILSFCISSTLHAQILENYSQNVEKHSFFRVFEKTDKLKIKVDLQSFPMSEVLVKLPKNSTIFLDSLLWIQVDSDTVFQISLLKIRQELQDINQPKVIMTVVNENLSGEEVIVIKGNGDLYRFLEKKPEKKSIYEIRNLNRFEDFFYISLLIPLFLLSLFKIIYPQFLSTIISPFDVFSSDDFSDSNSLVKFFSIHIVFYLLILNMFLASLGLLIFKELFNDTFSSLIGQKLHQYFFFWLLGTIILTLVSIIKFIYLKIITFVFRMYKISFSHYFYVLRILSIFILGVVLMLYFIKQNDIGNIRFILDWIVVFSFWLYAFTILMVFLMILNKVAYKNYHLFAYICMSELIPFLIISKIIVG